MLHSLHSGRLFSFNFRTYARPTASHPSDLPPPPPPSTFPFNPDVKAEPPSSKSSGGSSDRSTEPPLRKIKKEEDA